jgi:cytochrome c-type biogenesis protein CcmH/NrfG
MTFSHDDDVAPQAGDAAQKSDVEARGGIETGRVRWMLRFGLVGAVAALGVAYLAYVSLQPNANPPQPQHQQAMQTEAPPPHGAM